MLLAPALRSTDSVAPLAVGHASAAPDGAVGREKYGDKSLECRLCASWLASASVVGARFFSRRRCLRGRLALSSTSSQTPATVEEVATSKRPPQRSPERGEPTPYPEELILPIPVLNFLDVLREEEEFDAEELIYTMEDIQAAHREVMQWVQFPQHLAFGKGSEYYRGVVSMLRGVITCIDSPDDEVSMTAVATLNTLCGEGPDAANAPGVLVVEVGALSALVRACERRHDASVILVLTVLSRRVPMEMIPFFVKVGAVDAAVASLRDAADGMEQFQALEFLATLSKKAPASVALTGAYDVVKDVSIGVLMGRRNSIISNLEPYMEIAEDPMISAPSPADD